MLIGEVVLFLIAIFIAISKSTRLSVRPAIAIVIFVLFLISYVFVPYFFSIVSGQTGGLKSIFYILRVVGYSLVSLLLCSTALQSEPDVKLYQLFRNFYFFHACLAISYFIWAFLKTEPSIGDILGTVNPGARLAPMYGMTVTGGELPLEVVGGGATNLLASHALAVLVAARYFERSLKVELGLYLLSVVLVLLGQSRGGLITICIWGLLRVTFLRKVGHVRWGDALFISVIIIVMGCTIWSLSEPFALFKKYTDVVESGQLDSSSSLRLENYLAVFKVWSSSAFYITFGLGLDEFALEARTGWTVVESMYLSILFCGGFISLWIYLIFVGYVLVIKKFSIWLRVLILFIVVNSVVNWSVTGGDITGAPALFSIFFFLGAACRRYVNFPSRQPVDSCSERVVDIRTK